MEIWTDKKSKERCRECAQKGVIHFKIGLGVTTVCHKCWLDFQELISKNEIEDLNRCIQEAMREKPRPGEKDLGCD
jgi:hypothetical protein